MKIFFVSFMIIVLLSCNMFAARSLGRMTTDAVEPTPPPPWITDMVSGGSAGIQAFLMNPLNPGTHMFWAWYWMTHHYN